MDIVYVVRPGDDNEQLRYSLRSLDNIPHDKVFISGYTPEWVKNVISLNKVQSGIPDQENSNENLLHATLASDLSEDFLFMNDDFFIMHPAKQVPIMHQGLLTDVIARYETNNRFHQAYSLITTKIELAEQYGIENPLSYELHMPMMMNKILVLEMFKKFNRPLFALRPRTMYGNIYNLNGANTNDAKNSTDPKRQFISSGPEFAESETGQLVRTKFTRRSSYE